MRRDRGGSRRRDPLRDPASLPAPRAARARPGDPDPDRPRSPWRPRSAGARDLAVARRGRRNRPVPLVEVLYEGMSHRNGRSVVVRFARERRLRGATRRRHAQPRGLRPSRSASGEAAGCAACERSASRVAGARRSITAPPPPPPPAPTGGGWAVQVSAAPRGTALPPLASVAAFGGARAYVVDFEKDGAAWQRLRVGPFPTRQAAEAARTQLAARFPGAFLVADALPAERATPPPPTPPARAAPPHRHPTVSPPNRATPRSWTPRARR